MLGFDNLEQYLKKHPYFGATVGRVANRIAKGRFTLDGKTYTLAVNNGPNHLHGGLKGFDKKLWQAEPQAGAAVKFTYTSPDGEEGYPGTLAVRGHDDPHRCQRVAPRLHRHDGQADAGQPDQPLLFQPRGRRQTCSATS